MGQRGLGRGKLVAHCLLVDDRARRAGADRHRLRHTRCRPPDVDRALVFARSSRLRSTMARPRSRRSKPSGSTLARCAISSSPTSTSITPAGSRTSPPRASTSTPASTRRRWRARGASSASATCPRTGRTARAGRSTARTAIPGAACPAISRLRGARRRRRPVADARAYPRPFGDPGTRRPTAGWSHAGDAYFHRSSVEGAGSVPVGLAAFERITQIDAAARRASAAALRSCASATTISICSAPTTPTSSRRSAPPDWK